MVWVVHKLLIITVRGFRAGQLPWASKEWVEAWAFCATRPRMSPPNSNAEPSHNPKSTRGEKSDFRRGLLHDGHVLHRDLKLRDATGLLLRNLNYVTIMGVYIYIYSK